MFYGFSENSEVRAWCSPPDGCAQSLSLEILAVVHSCGAQLGILWPGISFEVMHVRGCS